MKTRTFFATGSFIAGMLVMVSVGYAMGPGGKMRDAAKESGSLILKVHDAGQVVSELRAKGYHRIQVVDPYLPKIQVNACKDGRRWHLHANYYGDIVHRKYIGRCGGYRYPSDYDYDGYGDY